MERVDDAITRQTPVPWIDQIATGVVRPMKWPLARGVLAHDDIYFGSSRMIELLTGAYIHEADHSMAAKWRPNPERPFYAAAVYQASIVSWVCTAEESIQRKARHFRATLAKAEDQLPADRPGVIHIGIETAPGADVAETRHIRNWLEASSFNTSTSRLRWVYASYFVPEITTAPNESWAITETTAPYKVGSHNTKWPLPDHLLLSPESDSRSGVYWAPSVST